MEEPHGISITRTTYKSWREFRERQRDSARETTAAYASVTEMLQELKAGVDVNLSEILQSLRKRLKGKQVLEHHWSALQEILDTLRGATQIKFTEIYSV